MGHVTLKSENFQFTVKHAGNKFLNIDYKKLLESVGWAFRTKWVRNNAKKEMTEIF